MTSKTEINARLEFWREALKALRKAYLALLDGGVKSYTLKDRELTLLDMPSLLKEIKEAEQKVDELEALASSGSRRKAVGVIPRDW